MNMSNEPPVELNSNGLQSSLFSNLTKELLNITGFGIRSDDLTALDLWIRRVSTVVFLLGLASVPYFIWRRWFSAVKAHVLLSGVTQDAHKTFMKRLKVKMNECSVESCSVVLLFCPVTTRMGTDIEEAVKLAPDNKPVVLVIMHHCYDPNLVLSPPLQLPKENIVKVVQCIFHESQGLLQCERNEKAIKEVSSALGKYKRKSTVPYIEELKGDKTHTS